jgi:RimJ/RimL family protein N-acetyltransferase
MLTRLSLPQYSTILPLFEPLDFNLVIRSVVEGNTPAWVYVDDPSSPHSAVIWDRQDAILVAGEAGEEARASVREVILNLIAPNARGRWIPEFALVASPSWEPSIPDLLGEFSPELARRYSFRLPNPYLGPPGGSQPTLPAGFELHRIGDSLLESRLAHLEEMRGWIDSFWHTPQDFLHTGYGYCAMTGDTIAAWCLTVFAAGSARELGLATVPDYRQRGLATCVAAACIEHGLAHDQQIHWHCWVENRPSARITEQLGFRLEREYSVYHLTV